MRKYVGLWIDHKQAIIVSIADGQEKITHIESGVEGRRRVSGGSSSDTHNGPRESVSEKHLQERRKHQLSTYYHRVIRAIRDAQSIFILGPAEAKIELRQEILKSGELASRVAGTETADRMTENQIVAKVREVFGSPG